MATNPPTEKASLAPTKRLPGAYLGVDGNRNLHHYRMGDRTLFVSDGDQTREFSLPRPERVDSPMVVWAVKTIVVCGGAWWQDIRLADQHRVAALTGEEIDPELCRIVRDRLEADR